MGWIVGNVDDNHFGKGACLMSISQSSLLKITNEFVNQSEANKVFLIILSLKSVNLSS